VPSTRTENKPRGNAISGPPAPAAGRRGTENPDCGPEAILTDELDADGLAAAPDHFAVSPGAGVARKRQRQFGRQRVGIVDRDLGAGRGHILHHALTRREAALQRDPSGLMQRFATCALFGVGA